MNWPRIIGILLIVFAVFYVFTQPANAAEATRTLYNGIATGLTNLGIYVKALLK